MDDCYSDFVPIVPPSAYDSVRRLYGYLGFIEHCVEVKQTILVADFLLLRAEMNSEIEVYAAEQHLTALGSTVLHPVPTTAI